ncbi:PREDICTED: uncharacterized protein LOC108689877 [Atta colombica]|uniref:uncharacterized protein LOC108689877 n=1 Tax=Atta colombica TaxID=520822 RepID=UPI00084C9DBD|nr:PREDICTED: uncharacterized protein LOC108689877 [Atta colombica]XP_018052318.1 PREDICTED: uncharacterized protein LOC108689877 [Atta colombica]
MPVNSNMVSQRNGSNRQVWPATEATSASDSTLLARWGLISPDVITAAPATDAAAEDTAREIAGDTRRITASFRLLLSACDAVSDHRQMSSNEWETPQKPSGALVAYHCGHR